MQESSALWSFLPLNNIDEARTYLTSHPRLSLQVASFLKVRNQSGLKPHARSWGGWNAG